MIKNKVIIWSSDDFNSLGLLRQLGGKDIDLFFLIKGNAGLAASSIYCSKYRETASLEEAKIYLLENFAREQYKPIVVTGNDSIITFIDRERSSLEAYFILPGTLRQGLSEKYTDKVEMVNLALNLGFLCPSSRPFSTKDSFDGIEYPCIVKPSHEKPGHYNEFKFRICRNQAELKTSTRFMRDDSEFIVQSLVPKEYDLLVYGARMWDGQTVLAGAMKRDRFSEPGSASHGWMLSEMPAFIGKRLISGFLDKIDYYGMFSFEYGVVNDEAWFFEVNLRNDGTSHYFYQNGANIPLAYVYSAAGEDYSCISTSMQETREYIDEIYDFENVLMGRISRTQWLKQMESAEIFRFKDDLDMEPYKKESKGKYIKMIRDIIIKKYRLYIVFILDKLGLRK